MHHPYNQRLSHEADFRVRYRFYSKEEGGRENLPFQGYRCDFWYDHSEHVDNHGLFMIWPEFEDASGEVILDDKTPVSQNGNAKMWIVIPERREYHRGKIKIGLVGYFMEGNIKTGECEVIELLDIATNATASQK